MCSGKCLESCGSLAVEALCVRTRSCIVIVEKWTTRPTQGFAHCANSNLSQLQMETVFPFQNV